jgi:ABC-type multidrug transport system fused ATPase/permease subunit
LRPPLAEGVRHLVITRICLAGVLLVSECRGKSKILLEPYCNLPPEEKSGILGRTFFWWINPILARGYKGLLDNSTIPGLKKALSSEYLRHVIVEAWRKSENDPLILTLVRCLLTPFVSVILPRLSVVLFRCSQPILISRAIRYVQAPTVEGDGQLEGYWLITMAVTIYLGLAISTATYQHDLNKLRIMVRGSLTSLIHARSLSLRRNPYDDATTVGLVSTDVSALENVSNMFHETWGNLAEVVVGTYLLSQQVGWLCGLPLFLVFLASRTSTYVAKNLKARQSGWNEATQRRLAVTSAVLGSMRDVKMLGMQDAAEENILRLRREEMDRARRVRWMMVVYNASGELS